MNSRDTEIVSALKLSIAEQIGSDRFQAWFRSTRIYLVDDAVRIFAANEFAVGYLRTTFRAEIESACQMVVGENAKVEFAVDENCAIDKASPTSSDSLESQDGAGSPNSPGSPNTPGDNTEKVGATSPRLHGSPACPTGPNRQVSGGKRKFAHLRTYAAGESNRIAISSAQRVATNVGSVSPLFLYGATGTGKSHLAEGIWSEVRRLPDRMRCVYLSSEQFTCYFLQALNGSGLPSFRQRYRHVDLLIIEDVQFFEGKRATIVELQHTIDSVLRDGRQVVITADRAPSDLGCLGMEMVNRFAGGLVIRVENPDREARQQILRQQAAKAGLTVPDNVIDFIADNFNGDVRRLHGAFNRLHAVSQTFDQPISLELATRALEDIVLANAKIVRLADIEQAVCQVFDLSPKNLRSSTRSRRISHPRMLAMALARKHTRAGLAEIGEFFGRRSHATVISASKKVDVWQATGSRVRMTDQECLVEDAIRMVERRLLG